MFFVIPHFAVSTQQDRLILKRTRAVGLFELFCLLIVFVLVCIVFIALMGVRSFDDPFAMWLFFLPCLIVSGVIAFPLYRAVRTIQGNWLFILDRTTNEILKNGKRMGSVTDLEGVEIQELGGESSYYSLSLILKGRKPMTIDYSDYWSEIDRTAQAICSYTNLGSPSWRYPNPIPFSSFKWRWPRWRKTTKMYSKFNL